MFFRILQKSPVFAVDRAKLLRRTVDHFTAFQHRQRFLRTLCGDRFVCPVGDDHRSQRSRHRQIDAIIAGMADTESRKEAINFTSPYHETIYALMVNAGTQYENATSLADFNGASVLGQKDTALDWTIDQIEGVNHLTAVASVPDMIARLQQGTCDAIVINLENAPGYLAANPDFVVISFPEGEGLDPGFKGACVGLRKSDDALLSLADAVLATIDQEQRDELWETALTNQPT